MRLAEYDALDKILEEANRVNTAEMRIEAVEQRVKLNAAEIDRMFERDGNGRMTEAAKIEKLKLDIAEAQRRLEQGKSTIMGPAPSPKQFGVPVGTERLNEIKTGFDETTKTTQEYRDKAKEAVDRLRDAMEPDAKSITLNVPISGLKPSDYVTKDSGERRNFDTGAVRDKSEGKGRYDLLPGKALEAVGRWFKVVSSREVSREYVVDAMLAGCTQVLAGERDGFYYAVVNAMILMERDETGTNRKLLEATLWGLDRLPPTAIRRIAQLYERGAVKYDARNWEKGMPLSVYLDSMTRHAFQVSSGVMDEDHLAAVCFNGLAAIHFLVLGRKELDDLPGGKQDLPRAV